MANRRLALVWMGALTVGCFNPAVGDDSGGDGETTDTPEPATTAPNTTDPATTAQPDGSGGSDGPMATTANDTTDDGPNDDGPPPIKLDQGVIPDAPMFCNEGEGEVESSFIWVANSTQSTIS